MEASRPRFLPQVHTLPSLPTVFRWLALLMLAPLFSSAPAAGPQTGIKAGLSKVDVTPGYPVRLSGYGNRREETTEVEQRIFAKGLALGTGPNDAAVLLTVDNCGISATMRREVAGRLQRRFGLPDERIAICSSHTHSAPMILGVLPNLFSMDIPPGHMAGIERYTRELTDWLEQAAVEAIQNMVPARLSWDTGTVGFAKNRRTVQTPPGTIGPVDHALSVLRITDANGKVRGVLCSYACHCTTVSFNRIHGDWAGCAQRDMESDFPGTIALTAIGCGADQNPAPRGTYELADAHGRALADEVRRVMTSGPMKPIKALPMCRTKHVQLPFDTPRSRSDWEERAASKSANIAHHARKNLERLDRGESLPTSLPYMVQTWVFAEDMAMVFLPGEVVVDYALRLKKDFDGPRLWVNAYANDVPCYIPSARVLKEGGYEGETAMVYYDRPNKFSAQVEETIAGAVREIIPAGYRRNAP